MIQCNCCAYECTVRLDYEDLTFRMTTIQIIRVAFGTPASDAAASSMERWLGAHCRDWRRSDAGGEVAADFILDEPMEAKRFRPLMAMHVKNWGFTRKRYARSNYTPMSIHDYLKDPPSVQTRVLVFHLLRNAYEEATIRVRAILKERAKARRERARARKEAKKTKKKAHRRIRKRFLRA